jgi:hypothetical protein
LLARLGRDVLDGDAVDLFDEVDYREWHLLLSSVDRSRVC